MAEPETLSRQRPSGRNRSQAPATSPDDITLLKAIVEQRDRAAFDALFLRYQNSAFSLASHILQNAALAEEAVQEAMLSIWTSPRLDLGDRTPREWILGTVAGKSLNVRRGNRKQSRREKTVSDGRAAHVESSTGSDDNELLTALRTHIDQLPEHESQLLACSFGANLPHRKISELLGIPKSTISFRIQQALQHLHVNLQKSGLAAAVPLAATGGLQVALTEGARGPAELHAKVMQVVDRASSGSGSSRRIRRKPLKSGQASALPGMIAASMVAALGLIAYAQVSPAPKAIVATAAPAPVVAPPAPVPAVPVARVTPIPAPVPLPRKQAKLFKRWRFDQGPAADLPPLHGTWYWHQNGNSGYMETDPRGQTCIKLPIGGEHLPFRVSITKTAIKSKKLSTFAQAAWLKSDGLPCAYESWAQSFTVNSEVQRFECVCYFNDRYVLNYMDSKLSGICRLMPGSAPDCASIFVENSRIEEICIESLDPSELPPEFLNMDATIAKCQGPGTQHTFQE